MTYTAKQLEEMYPGMYDVTQQDTDDILHDYQDMVSTFGPEDDLVIEYRRELEERGVLYCGHLISEHKDGYTVEGCDPWFFKTLDLMRDYIDKYKS